MTRFDCYTLPVHIVWRQVGTYKVEQAPALLESFAKWQETGASDVKATVALIIGVETATVGLIYSESVDEQPASFAPFKDIPPLELRHTTSEWDCVRINPDPGRLLC